jgi:hypothetical protein
MQFAVEPILGNYEETSYSQKSMWMLIVSLVILVDLSTLGTVYDALICCAASWDQDEF